MAYTQYHVFSLPQELLDTLIPRTIFDQANPPPREDSPEPQSSAVVSSNVGSSARACNVCPGATFKDVDEQRAHFRSDWHRYNVKSRIGGSKTVSEAQFSQLVDELDDSLSGSESSSDTDSDAVETLVNRSRALRVSRSPSPSTSNPTGPQTALAWFHSPPSTQLGIYKVLFPLGTSPTSYLSELKALQGSRENGRTWAMFMTAGGHFAGAIVRVSRPESEEDEPVSKKGKPKKPKPEIEILKHKTFHRYTTRRKQGGAQSTNDNAKSKAVSAGAMLRRYGEQALREDIRKLIQDWAEDIDDCERIFIRASVSNRRIFLDYDGAIINKGDDRLRTFPFPTRRPTQSELSRCLSELTRVKVSHYTEEELRAQDEAYLAALEKAKPKPPVIPQAQPSQEKAVDKEIPLTPEESLLRDKWTRVLEMVHKGRLDALKSFWEREGAGLGGVDARVPDWAGERGRTLLQVATRAGQVEVTKWLLDEARADPTIDVPASENAEDDEGEGRESDEEGAPALPSGARRTAYDLARTRDVRNVFRRSAAAHPEWWDWLGREKGARVPSILSAEMEEGRDEKKKVRRKGLKEKVKEREAREKEKESRAPSPIVEEQRAEKTRPQDNGTGPRKLGGTAGSFDNIAGLTPEMRLKVERERRARAVEARLRNLR